MKTLLARSVRAWHAMPLLLSVASVLSVRSPGQVILPGPAIRSIQAGSGITVTTNGTSRTVTYSGSSGDITGGAVTGGLLTVSEGAGILTYGLTTNAVRTSVTGIYLPLSGGTMSGAINMGQANITYAGALGLYDGSSMPNTGEISLEGNIPTWTFSGNSHTIWHSGNDGSVSQLDAGYLQGQRGSFYLNGANITNGTAIAGLVDMPSGHTAGVTNLVGIAGDGVTPVFVPTSANWNGCSVYRGTSNQALALSAVTVVLFNAEIRDASNLYNTSTGYFRPNKTGLWRLTGGVNVANTSGNPAVLGGYLGLYLRRVSDSVTMGMMSQTRIFSTSTSMAPMMPGSSVVELVSGVDYAVVFNNGDSKEVTLYASQASSFFVAEYVSP